MEIHLGVIRDKQGIYTALRQSQATNRQLAVCFNQGGKLMVKICTVVDITGKKKNAEVTLKSQAVEPEAETVILLDRIQSIYPIQDFV